MRSLVTLLALALLAGCVSEPRQAAPPPPAAPPPAPKPASAPPAPLAASWEDWPLTPGTWVWRQDARGSVALFGPPGGDALFIARCDRQARAVFLSRGGSVAAGSAAQMILRTSSALKAFPALPNADTPPYAAARLAASDSALDAVAYTRGRFVVSVTGLADLVLPSAPEMARITEDCRG